MRADEDNVRSNLKKFSILELFILSLSSLSPSLPISYAICTISMEMFKIIRILNFISSRVASKLTFSKKTKKLDKNIYFIRK